VILSHFNVTKLEVEYMKLALSAKKEDKNADKNFFASLEFDFLRVQLKFAFFKYGRKTWKALQ